MTVIARFGAPLTPREKQVVNGIVSGRQTKEIARDLGCSPRTIDHHRKRIRRKLGARSIPELVRIVVTSMKDAAAQ